MRYLLLAVVACGGGSPAAPFLGTWRGNQSTTVTPNVAGQPPRMVGGMAIETTFAEDLTTGAVDFGDCQSGTPSGDTLTLSPSKAPCVVSENGCSLALTTTTGSVKVRGDSMTLDYGGSYSLDCSGSVELGTFGVHANLTRVR